MEKIIYKPHIYKEDETDSDIKQIISTPSLTSVLGRDRLSSTSITPYQTVFTDSEKPEDIEVQEVETSTPATTRSVQTVSQSTPQGGRKHNVSATLQGVLDIFDKYGLTYNVTSGHRPGAKTAQGRQSFHATGSAMDITPRGMTYDDWKERIKNTPEIQEYFRTHKLGILDETTSEMLKRTGGTGAHWHIGPDRIAQETFKEWYGKKGGKIKDIRKLQSGGILPITYQTHNYNNAKTTNQSSVPLASAGQIQSHQPLGYVPQYNFAAQQQPHYKPNNYVERLEVHEEKDDLFDTIKSRINAKGQNWTDKEISQLIDTFSNHDFDLNHIVDLIESESKFNPKAQNENSTATGLFQFIQSTAKDILGEEAAKQYASNSRSISDQIKDGKIMIDKINKNIKSDRDKLTFGRLKVNMLSPNHPLEMIIPDSVWHKSLSADIMRNLKRGKSTYRDLMDLFDSGFKN